MRSTEPLREAPQIPINPSKCCFTQMLVEPLLLVDSKGDERFLGKVWYCPKVDWGSGKKNECNRIKLITYKKRWWPGDLDTRSIPGAVGREGPSYWLSRGFHLVKFEGEYVSIRKTGGMPDYNSLDDLSPLPRRIVEYRLKRGNFDADVNVTKGMADLAVPDEQVDFV